MTESTDPRVFRQALGRFPTGVTIVTTSAGPDPADWVGVTANSFNSVSLDPPMVLWSLGRNARSFETFVEASHFAVHILAESQQGLSNRFARTIDDKFDGIACATGVGGVPLLADCVACFECRTAHVYEGGDHLIFVGEVLNFSHSDRVPLVFHEGRYAALEEHPELAWAGRAGRRPSDAPFAEDHLHALVTRASQRLAAAFHRAVREAGLDVMEWRILATLAGAGQDALTLEELADATVMKRNDVADLVDRMVGRGLLQRAPAGSDQVHRIAVEPAGRALMDSLAERAREQEREALAQCPPAQLQDLKAALRSIAGTGGPG
ncbi:MAG: flavin reductase [Sneathiellaceae bacterium]